MHLCAGMDFPLGIVGMCLQVQVAGGKQGSCFNFFFLIRLLVLFCLYEYSQQFTFCFFICLISSPAPFLPPVSLLNVTLMALPFMRHLVAFIFLPVFIQPVSNPAVAGHGWCMKGFGGTSDLSAYRPVHISAVRSGVGNTLCMCYFL